MQIDEGNLRAYLDQALSPAEMARIRQAVAGSAELQASLARLSRERQAVTPYLAGLAPPAGDQADPDLAWSRFLSSQPGQSNPIKIARPKERIAKMINKPLIKRYQPALIIVAVIAILAIAFSFAPVRATARNLLKSFRVQNVEVVRVEREDMEALRQNPNLQELMERLKAQLEVVENPEPQQVDSLEQAAQLAGFPVSRLTALPEGTGDPAITVNLRKVVELHLDKELLQALFDAAGIEVNLPDSLDQEPLVVTQPNTVTQKWTQEDQELLEFVQMTPPAIDYPDDLDLNALGTAGLQLLGLSPEEAADLAERVDWATTFIFPVPSDSDVIVTEVTIKDSQGFLFSAPDSENAEAAVMWTGQGKNYFLRGNFSPEQMLELARSAQ